MPSKVTTDRPNPEANATSLDTDEHSPESDMAGEFEARREILEQAPGGHRARRHRELGLRWSVPRGQRDGDAPIQAGLEGKIHRVDP